MLVRCCSCNLRLEMIALSNTTGEQPFPVAAAGDESATLFRSKPEAGQEFCAWPLAPHYCRDLICIGC